MHAMQYEVTLPADYDTAVIRARVEHVGRRLDDWDGLGIKAYLLRERGRYGSPVNQYAPFYLWNTVAGMNRFLWGGAFQGLVDDFGRPEVRQWTGLAHAEGRGTDAAFAVRRRVPVPDRRDLSELMAEAVAATERLAGADGAVLAAAAVDPHRWELVHFSLWEHDAPQAEGDVFEVLHLSAPGRDRLPRGRQW
ncbi:DUF4865 family protein [Streptomyces sp. LP11]|uniref:DUF4865 family protein n=1 Tax=Streptomyces pyxinicus TaxID=2970331 RepID=A0ABT2B627_9ACTN|nr:DUF4865 family protein [Streptomyces sp. LP11]MCS0603875.1 DUF4865 family protein [Streptomyces sp. LP11]